MDGICNFSEFDPNKRLNKMLRVEPLNDSAERTAIEGKAIIATAAESQTKDERVADDGEAVHATPAERCDDNRGQDVADDKSEAAHARTDGVADLLRGRIPGKELRLIEVCAGHGGVTAAWRNAGMVADDPIELYADPDARTGERPDHDLLRKEVQ